METGRYREEEKELENETSETIEEEKEDVDDVDTEIEELESEIKKESKQVKKLKKKNQHLELEIETLNETIKTLKDQLLRNQAELENFKRRTNEERIKERKYAMQDYFMEVIDILDVFDQAVNVKTDDEKLNKYLSGFVMINNRFKQILESYGVKKIECLHQPFDPAFHQAMEVVEADGVESNIVVEVVMSGYTYKDRVLRPSMVKVSK
ncbi:MAG: nucleotide exchange factor GrpE [Anaeroplasma bactoclasticum]|nr:nucleotide exchange factor GrpE [Anaeroplasma bactoclasticum]